MSTSVPSATYAGILRLPQVSLVFASAMAGRFAYPLVGLPLLLAVEQATGSFSAAGVAAGAYGATAGFLAPARARILDRFGRRRGLLTFAVLFALSLLVLALVTSRDSSTLWCVAAAGVAGGFAPPLGPTMRVVWATLVPSPALLRKALSLDAVLEELLYLAGPALTGFVLISVSPSAALVIPAVLIVAGTVLMVSSPAVHDDSPRPAPARSTTGLLSEPRFIALLVPVLATGFVVGNVYVAVPAMVGTASTVAVGVVLALFGAGSAVGGLIYGVLHLRSSTQRQLLMLAALLAVGSASAVLATSAVSLGIIVAASGLFLAPVMIVAYVAANGFGGPARPTESTTWVNTSHNVGAAAGSAAGGLLIEAWNAKAAFIGSAASAALLLLISAAVYAVPSPTAEVVR
jgi:predicted MFS family arabinose efflux permease